MNMSIGCLVNYWQERPMLEKIKGDIPTKDKKTTGKERK